MNEYPYYAEVLVDQPLSTALSAGQVVIVGGSVAWDALWIPSVSAPHGVWAVRSYQVRRLDRPCEVDLPHAGETHPFSGDWSNTDWPEEVTY